MANLQRFLPPINAEQAADIRSRLTSYDAWSQQFKQRNGWTVIPADATPPVAISNDERSALEVFEFCRDKPDRLFAYIKKLPNHRATLTTWTGDHLGHVSYGRTWRDNFGGQRVSIRVAAINGETYSGTYYKSAGDYARLRRIKS